MVRINLGSGESVLSSKSGLKLSDSSWHRVDIDRSDAELQLTIDGLHTTFLDIVGRFFELNVKFGLYVGGLGNFDELFLGNLQYFRGCLDQLYYNGIDVIESASRVTGGINSITFDCNEEFDANDLEPISFIDSGAYMSLPGFSQSARTGGTLTFDVKTNSNIAALFYNTDSASHQSDFIAVEIINGRIALSVNDGNRVVVLQSDAMVNDGNWHHVEIQFTSSFLEVNVDGKARNLRPSMGENRFFDLTGQLFVGGIELNKQTLAFQQGLQSVLSEGPESSLKGCMKAIKMNQQVVGIVEADVTKGIRAGECVWQFPCLSEKPCVTGAECFQEGLQDFRCLCDTNVCVKPNFTTSYKTFNVKKDTSVLVDVEILKLQPLEIAEGGSDLITSEHIHVVLDYQKFGIRDTGVLFHIVEPPRHGMLEIEVWSRSNGGQVGHHGNSDNLFTLADLTSEKVRYTHDGSESHNDSIILDLELHSRSDRLPSYIDESAHQFLFHIKVLPVNDMPKIVTLNSVLSLPRNTKATISNEILTTEDGDSAPQQIRYSLVTFIDAGESYIEHVNNPGIPIDAFTQHDINRKMIRFVHQSKLLSSQCKAIFTISDGHESPSIETTLSITLQDLQINQLNNTGLSMPYNSQVLIRPENLTFATNAEPGQNLDVRYDISKAPIFGSIQKLRLNGLWLNVSHFSQRHINRNKIRYVHNKGNPVEDKFEFQVSYVNIKYPNPVQFVVQFLRLQLKSMQNQVLLVEQGAKEIIIDEAHLKYGTDPYPSPGSQIIFTILSLPSHGSLYASREHDGQTLLNIGSFVTQEMIDDHNFLYRSNATSYTLFKDSFDFEVTTQGGLTNVDVATFQIKLSRNIGNAVIVNEKLTVIEGDKATITTKVLHIEPNGRSSAIIYNITSRTRYGTLKLLNTQLNDVFDASPDQITSQQIEQNRFVYYHDDSEHNSDEFEFAAIDEDFVYNGVFKINIRMKNDNPPIRIIDRVFNVVMNQEKKLTGNDLRYVDADVDSNPADVKYTKTYVPNGNLYWIDRAGVVVEQFTQEDLDKEKILFRHNGDENGRAILWITDGQFYASGVLEIKASKAYVRIVHNSGLIVKGGESALITIANLSVDTNMNVKRKSDINFKVTSGPKFGTIMNGGKETTRFTLQDLQDENVEYESNPSINDGKSSFVQDHFKFVAVINDITVDGQVNISTYPENFFDQLTVVNNKSVYVDEGKVVTLDSSTLKITHTTLLPANITYLITQLPKFGILNLAHSNLSSHMINHQDRESLLIFTQADIDEGEIHYLQTDINRNLTQDSFKFDVTNGITTITDLEFHINIIAKIITISTGNVTVREGHVETLTQDDFMISNDYHNEWIDEFLIIEEPKFGTIKLTSVRDGKILASTFTPYQLRQGLVEYEHDGSETMRDWFTIVARSNQLDKESAPATIHVTVEPINDETPHVVNNTGIELWEGTSVVITNSILAALDEDSLPDEVIFEISTPSNGYVALINDKNVHVDRFTQELINEGQIVYVHSGELSGGFRFQVNDGTNYDSPHVFTVAAKPVRISVTVNEKLSVFPGMQQSITKDHLLSSTNEGNSSREIMYQVIREARFGRLLLENLDGTTKPVMMFTQTQVNNNLVLYEQSKPIQELLVIDEITFDVESRRVQTLRGVKFSIEIAMGHFGKTVAKEMRDLVQIVPMTCTEGKEAIIDSTHVNTTGLITIWQNKQYKGFSEKLFLRLLSFPVHGSVLYENEIIPNTRSTSVSISALQKGLLIYQHDDSNSFNDSIVLGLYIHNGNDISLVNKTLEIIIIPVNDEPATLLTSKPRISVVQDSKTPITNTILDTRDEDGLPREIIYDLINGPPDGTEGYFLLDEIDVPITNFTQLDIEMRRVYFKQNGSRVPEIFHFKLVDGPFPPIYDSFDIQVIPLTLKLVNHTGITILQGTKLSKLTSKHLSAISNDGKKTNILFDIKIYSHRCFNFTS